MPDNYNSHKYLNFKESDFISDAFFQDWIIKPNSETDEYWRNFIKQHPTKKEIVESARYFLQNLLFNQDFPDEQLVQQSLATHLKRKEEYDDNQRAKVRRIKVLRNALKFAAVFGGVVLLVYSLFYFNKSTKDVFVQTTYGNIKSFVLPDSSAVVLNANSKFRYKGSWNVSKSREVWLEGEAFFDVRHLKRDKNQLKSHDRFIVHLKDLDVEVLGTSFNIRSRRGKTEVVLQTGEIKITLKNKGSDILMKPNDIVVYNDADGKVKRASTIAQEYTGWKEGNLILYDPTINEIIQYLEDNFGKKIILEKHKLGTKKIEGPILYNNLDDVLFIISTLLQADVIKENDDRIIIRPR